MIATPNGPRMRETVIILLLNQTLLNISEMERQLNQVRVRVTGPHAAALRALVEGFVSELHDCAHLIDERLSARKKLVQLYDCGKQESGLPGYPRGPMDCQEHLENLLSRYALFARSVYHALGVAKELGFQEEVELFGQIVCVMNRSIWFLEIHWEANAIGMDSSHLPDWTPNLHAGYS